MSPLTVDPAGYARPARVTVGAVAFDPFTDLEAVTFVRDALARGNGGRLTVVDADLQRRAAANPSLSEAIEEATLVLPEWMPAVWASRIAGLPLAQSFSGSSLVEALCVACAADRRRIFVIGGAPGTAGVPSGAQRAAAVLGLRCPGLRVAGCVSPPAGLHADPAAWSGVIADVLEAKPDLVLLGGGTAVQEKVFAALRPELPGMWIFGCSGLVDLVSGSDSRRGRWRALRHAGYAVRLLAGAATTRVSGWLRARVSGVARLTSGVASWLASAQTRRRSP